MEDVLGTTGKLKNKTTGEALTVTKRRREEYLIAGCKIANSFDEEEWTFIESPTPGVVLVEKKEHLIAHIEGLQSALTKRNAEIERLVALVEQLQNGEPGDGALRKAYKNGYLAATYATRSATSTARAALGEIDRAIYLGHPDVPMAG